jgi:hypothetical protein
MSREDERQLSTADFATAGERTAVHEQPMQRPESQQMAGDSHASATSATAQAGSQRGSPGEPLAALFLSDVAEDFRHRWDAIQIGFVDDPQQAVRSADELVAQVMKSLAATFAQQRSDIESGIDQSDHANTENLRVALQRYRSFFQRLLSL